MNAHRHAALAALAIPLAARAEFEGRLDGRMTGSHADGTARLWVSNVGARMEIDVKSSAAAEAGRTAPPRVTKLVTIYRKAEPDLTYLVNVEQKTYTVLDARQAPKMGGGMGSDETFTVKKLGGGKVAGLACQRALVTSSRGKEIELCADASVLGGTALLESLEHRTRSHLYQALRDAGVAGFPLRWAQKGTEGAVTWEVVAAHRQSVPRSTFEIPADYQKTGLLGTMTTPEQQKKMEEAMKKMTPEQRQKMEELMKRYQGGK